MRDMCYFFSARENRVKIGNGSVASSNLYIDNIAVHYKPEGVDNSNYSEGVKFSNAEEVMNSTYKDAFATYINRRIDMGTMIAKKCRDCGIYFIIANEQMKIIKKASRLNGTVSSVPVRCELCRNGYIPLTKSIELGKKFENIISQGEVPPFENEIGESYFALNFTPSVGFFYEPYRTFIENKSSWGLTSFIFVGVKEQIEIVCNYYNRMLVTHEAKVQKCADCGKYFVLTNQRKQYLKDRGFSPSALCRDCGKARRSEKVRVKKGNFKEC